MSSHICKHSTSSALANISSLNSYFSEYQLLSTNELTPTFSVWKQGQKEGEEQETVCCSSDWIFPLSGELHPHPPALIPGHTAHICWRSAQLSSPSVCLLIQLCLVSGCGSHDQCWQRHHWSWLPAGVEVTCDWWRWWWLCDGHHGTDW